MLLSALGFAAIGLSLVAVLSWALLLPDCRCCLADLVTHFHTPSWTLVVVYLCQRSRTIKSFPEQSGRRDFCQFVVLLAVFPFPGASGRSLRDRQVLLRHPRVRERAWLLPGQL